MNDFLPTSIVELQNTLTFKNIEELKQDFIKRNFIEDEPPNLLLQQEVDSLKKELHKCDMMIQAYEGMPLTI